MQFFRIKKVKNKNYKSIIFRERKRKFDKEIDTYISKTKPLLIFGKSASGKTKEITKLWDNKEYIWNPSKFNFIWLSGTDSITEILHKNLTPDDSSKFTEEKFEEYLDFDIDLDEHINKQYIKLRVLAEKSKNSILFFDDIDKITGKKLELAKELLRNCKFFIATANDDNTINKTVSHIINRKKPTIIDFNSQASYDATNILLMFFVLALFGSGMYEAAMLIVAGRFAMKGVENK